MNIQLRSIAAAAMLASSLAVTVQSASAAPFSIGHAPAVATTTQAPVEQVRYYGRGGWGFGAGLLGGAIIGGALAAPYYYRPYYGPAYYAPPPPAYYAPAYRGDAVAYCAQRFRSYDPRSGTYMGYDGLRHPCP